MGHLDKAGHYHETDTPYESLMKALKPEDNMPTTPTHIKDLGWLNEGGKAEQAIRDQAKFCKDTGHKMRTVNVGMYGTVHDTYCANCEYVYHEDSGD